jgi:Rrf2 family iron-sulfur cluster assembly transcriptional regulator
VGQVLKISKATSIAMHALILLAEKHHRPMSNRRIADSFNISANHSSKVMQKLLKSGLVNVLRGPGGGYTLSADPKRVSLLDIYLAVDGEPDSAGCLFGSGKHCSLDTCLFSELISDADKLIRKHLGAVTLADYIDKDISLVGKAD